MSATQALLLSPYQPPERSWTRRDAAHLLWRAQHGASIHDIDRAHSEGLGATLDRLLTTQDETREFQASEALLRKVAEQSGNIEDLKAWWAHRLLKSANPLVEKMALFWHNHFATSNAKVRSSEQMAAQNRLFREHALLNFRDLVHQIARDVAMLVWLDSNANRNRSPNENFARELMELFSLGVGNYSEKDIQETARAFTGWHVREGAFWFNPIQHDTREKKVLGRSGNLDGGDVVELCLEQPAAPRFLTAKLLHAFVMPQPQKETVEALSECIRSNNFAMRPVLRQLLGSTLFFSPEARASIIKSPADLVLGALRSLEGKPNLQSAVRLMAKLGQDLFEPPTVKGWEGGRLWINSASMLMRANFAAELATGEELGAIAQPESLARAHRWTGAADGVVYYAELLLARDVPGARDMIVERLRQTNVPLVTQLRSAIYLLMTMPEFQMM
jgi:uncharacterized protein (DUF1800 family)